MADIRVIESKEVDLDKAAEELGIRKESLTKDKRAEFIAWVKKQK